MATRIAGFVYTLSTGLAAGGVTVTPRASDGSVGATGVTDANGFIAIAGLADKTWIGTVANSAQVFSPCTIAEQLVSDDLHGQSNTLSAHDFSQLRGKVVSTQVNSQTAALSTVLTADGAGNATWAAGGGGSPGGSNTQLQYNNAGAFGGTSGLTWDGTDLKLAGSQVLFFRDILAINSPSAGFLQVYATTELQLNGDAIRLLDQANNVLAEFVDPTGTIVNYLRFAPSIATAALPITAVGTDANITINLVAKGSGDYQLGGVASTGAGGMVRATSPTLVTPLLGTPTSGVLTNCTGLPVAGGGTGVSTIAALSIWLANSANVITSVTPGAGNSIRINAGATAWEAYTPGAGGIPTLITVANEAVDTTCFLLFATAATGDLGPKTNAGLKYQSDINALVVGGITATGISATSINSLTITTSTGTLTIPNGVVLTGPASSGTVMTLGNTETAGGAKTWSAAQTWNATCLFQSTSKATFRDADLSVGSSVDGQLDISADVLLALGNTAGGNIGVGIPSEVTLRTMAPQTDGKMDLGSSSLGFADFYQSGQTARLLKMNRHTTAASAGNTLTVNAGGCVSGGTNLAGGQLTLASGVTTGSGVSSVALQVYPGGAAATTDNTILTAVTIAGTTTAATATITLADKVDFVFNTTTGTKIGTGATQKLGFFGATPLVQRTTYTQTYATASKTVSVNTSAAITDTADSTYSANEVTMLGNLKTAVNALRTDVDNAKSVINQLINDLKTTTGLGLITG